MTKIFREWNNDKENLFLIVEEDNHFPDNKYQVRYTVIDNDGATVLSDTCSCADPILKYVSDDTGTNEDDWKLIS